MMAVQVVIFALGREEYAMPIDVVREITRLNDVLEIPQVPSYVLGLINLRGKAIPLIDLHKRFNLKEPSENSLALITEVHGDEVGFAVDRVHEVRILDNVAAPPSIVQAPFVGGIVNLENRMIIQLVPEQILENSVVQELSQLITR
jgi:purine-binding chemotaxis protein CheW